MDNGVVLRNTDHRGGQGVQTDDYYRDINERFAQLGENPPRGQVIETLHGIRSDIKSGTVWTKK